MRYGIITLSIEDARRILDGKDPLPGKNRVPWSENLIEIEIDRDIFRIIAIRGTEKEWIRMGKTFPQAIGKVLGYDCFRHVTEEEATMLLFGAHS